MNRRRQGGQSPGPVPPNPDGFNFTDHIQRLCRDITNRLSEFRHIDMQRVAISVSRTRKPVRWGLYATTTPMRFEGGSRTTKKHGIEYRAQQLFAADVEMLYIVNFYLPRFMDIDFREKLITVFHELWHISPDFNGDLRRHPGRCYAHSGSQKQYDDHMARFVDHYLSLSPPGSLYEFLKLSFLDLHEQHGSIFGTRIPRPKLFPVKQTSF